MDISNYTFVALDLETTGLDTSSCRIIEIAAVRFHIAFDGDKYVLLESEERSMLIDPEIEITSEVTMITGISEPMIRGKSKWHEVKEKVADFIGDAIIVGHNVLFDIEVLKNHELELGGGIKECGTQTCNLQPATCNGSLILDTFELSELLAQDAESLNLSFLANLYGFSTPGEHRALDDTMMSVHLFLYFLTRIQALDTRKQSIFSLLSTHDESGMMELLCNICEISKNTPYVLPHSATSETRTIESTSEKGDPILELTSFRGEPETEVMYLEKLTKKGPLLLLVQGQKQMEWIERECRKHSISVARYYSQEKYISLKQLTFRLAEDSMWSRKYMVLIGKILFWLEDTKMGILSELKYYGDERAMIDEFRGESGEIHTFIETSEKEIEDGMVTIAEVHDALRDNLILEKCLVIRDIERFDDAMRHTLSQSVDFTLWQNTLENLLARKAFESDLLERCSWGVSALEFLFLSSVKRPTGPDPLPPGDFGETYHCTQASIWDQGGRWSILYLEVLLASWKSLRLGMTTNDTRQYKLQIETIENYIQTLQTLLTLKKDTISIILSIQKESTRMSAIPRNVRSHISHYFTLYGDTISGYGTSISGEIMQKFIREEIYQRFDISGIAHESFSSHRLIVRKTTDEMANVIADSKGLEEGATHIILTTSLKHIREIGTRLRKIHLGAEVDIFIQGISGGKGKILTNFLNSKKKKILIGLIDTWKDEFEIWERAHLISIMKLPFDPPTDVRFLARTVGMKDNFEGYSIPTTLIKMNTLFGRIISSGYNKEILCYDERLISSEWGKKMYQEML